MMPIERRSVADTGVRHSVSESPSANAARVAAPSSMRSASDEARLLTDSPVFMCSCGLRDVAIISGAGRNNLKILGVNLGRTIDGFVMFRPELDKFASQLFLAVRVERRERTRHRTIVNTVELDDLFRWKWIIKVIEMGRAFQVGNSLA